MNFSMPHEHGGKYITVSFLSLSSLVSAGSKPYWGKALSFSYTFNSTAQLLKLPHSQDWEKVLSWKRNFPSISEMHYLFVCQMTTPGMSTTHF